MEVSVTQVEGIQNKVTYTTLIIDVIGEVIYSRGDKDSYRRDTTHREQITRVKMIVSWKRGKLPMQIVTQGFDSRK